MGKSISKTFQKGDEFFEPIEWVTKNIEVHEWQPEGTEWSGGEPGPHDPRCELMHKYVITITKVSKEEKDNG